MKSRGIDRCWFAAATTGNPCIKPCTARLRSEVCSLQPTASGLLRHAAPRTAKPPPRTLLEAGLANVYIQGTKV